MKNLLLSLIITAAFGAVEAQSAYDVQPVTTNSFYLELGGQGFLYTFNYDLRLDRSHVDGLGFRMGMGGIAVNDFSFFTLPLAVNELLGKNGKYFEASAGPTFVFGSDYLFRDENPANFYLIGSIYVGYRSQPSDGGFVFRAGIPMNFGRIAGQTFVLPYPPGVSFGFCF